MIRNGRPVTVETDNGVPDKELLYSLSDDDLSCISDWIKDNVRPAESNKSGFSSYGLKHELERDTGIYLTNNQMKHAMLSSGYEPVDPKALNWEFNIALTRDIIENPSPFFNWLKGYAGEDSMAGDFAQDVIADRDFPAMADHDIVRRYLERHNACDGCMEGFEIAWKRWLKQRAS